MWFFKIFAIFIRLCQFIGPCVCCVPLFMGGYAILHWIISRKPSYVSDLSKLDALLYKTRSKVLLVLRCQGSAYVDLLYHQVKQYIKCGIITHSVKKRRQQNKQLKWSFGGEGEKKGEGVNKYWFYFFRIWFQSFFWDSVSEVFNFGYS